MGNNRAVTKTDKLIGERVRQRRLELSMSQEALADALGVTFQQVQKYEKGMNRIAASRLLSICNILDTSFSWLVNDVHETLAHARLRERLAALLATREGTEIIDLFCEMKSKALRRQAVELVRVLVRAESE